MDKRNPPIPAIDEIDLSQSLDGREGLNANYTSRIRTQYLFAQHQALLTQGQFADAKAIALITLMGFLMLRGPISIEAIALTDPLGVVFFALSTAALLLCLLTVVPRYPRKAKRGEMARQDRWSWPAIASDSDDGAAFSRFMKTSEVSQLVQSVALSNAAVSRILVAKYATLRAAFVLAILSLGVVALDVLRPDT